MALRVVLIFFALQLLQIPFLKIVGGILLLWIGVKLLLPQHEGGHEINAATNLAGAIRTIVVADAVMSLDNVIGIAAAAKDSLVLVVFGLVVSIPIIVWGSRFVLTLMDRFPLVIVFGAGLLGWIGGGMITGDAFIKQQGFEASDLVHYGAALLGALLVVAIGKLWPKPTAVAPSGPVDLVRQDDDAPK